MSADTIEALAQSSNRRRKAIQHYRHKGQTLDPENCLRCNSAWRAKKRWKREKGKSA